MRLRFPPLPGATTKFKLGIFLLLSLFLLPAVASAQQSAHPATSFSFGAAKAHSHEGAPYEVTGYFCGRAVVADSTNNTGNFFYGNAICVNRFPDGPTWYWYDWSADPDASQKLSIWLNTWTQWVTIIVADHDCLLAVDTYDPWL